MLTQTPLWPEPPAPPTSPRPRRGTRASERRRKRWTIGIVAAVTSLVVAAGSAYAFDVFDPEAATPSSAVAEAQVAIAESVSLQTALTTDLDDARAVLKSPDGKAANKSTRRALNTAIEDAERVVTSLKSVTTLASGTEVDASAVLKASDALDDDVPAVTAALREATGAVVASGRQARLARAVSGLEKARDGLKSAVADGEQVHAESAADAAGRDALRAALDDAGDLTSQADKLIARAAEVQTAAETKADASPAATAQSGTAQPGSAEAGAASEASTDVLGDARPLTKALTEATAGIKEAAAAVSAETADDAAEAEAGATDQGADDTGTDPGDDTGTTDDTDTAPAGTCPEPDQVWSAENGHLSSSELAQIPFASGHYVRSDVVSALAELNAAYAAEFGVNMTINSSYRTYAEQEALYDPSSKTAAPPGCSNHGTGLAIDIGGGVAAFGSAQYDWLKANAEAYGWVHPPFAEPSGRNPEPWHWQSVKAPNSY
ncbi:D-alanyl-D-alanine carboxypeptidase family protein [Promicromonospora sp. NPDC059942]|uniref:M15 family metallopeptidase n=1 Tax=Promicromonospora sp. NPDC059942 TaxID=3347009 RepID=UPI00365B0DF1